MPPAPAYTTHAPDADARFPVPLRGVQVGPQTRCAHYNGPHDIIAIRFVCCGVYYPCLECHVAATGHAPTPCPRARRHEDAVLCGACRCTMSAAAYLDADHACPHCGAAFNPDCTAHHDRYFAFG